MDHRRGTGPRHDRAPLPTQGRPDPRRSCPSSSTCCSSAARARRPTSSRHPRLSAADDEAGRRLRDRRRRCPNDIALLHFTSGTTGTPKGAVHVHEAVVAHLATGRLALDLHPDDVFWCTADPGWVTGTSYGIVVAARARRDEHRRRGRVRRRALVRDPRGPSSVSVWYTAPTAVRMMMQAGADVAREHRSSALAVHRQRRRAAQPRGGALGRGGVRPADPRQLVADRDRRDHDRQLRRDATSGPARWVARCPGIDAAILRRDEHGHVVVRDGEPSRSSTPMVEGELALRPGWPSMFRGYLGEPDRYRALLRRRLVPQRRPGDARRRRLLLVRRPRRRRHQVGRPSDRPVRGGERADGAPGGGRGRRDRQARSRSPASS